MAEPLTLINAFEVPGEQAEQFIAAWEKTRDYLETQPGYVDTALHQAIMPGADFQFVNIAHWRTAEDFRAAIQSPGFLESAAGLAGYRPIRACTRSCGPDRPDRADLTGARRGSPALGLGTHHGAADWSSVADPT